MTQSPSPSPAFPPPDDRPPRTVQRIALETFLVGLLGATVWGIAWELGHDDLGWIIAIIIWVAGAPLLEGMRLIQSSK